jgi:RNA polymerase sigma-70 factor (sigma-E family)
MAAQGDVPLEHYVAQYGLDLTRFAYLVCGDRSRAEDLVQEVYLAMYRRFGDRVPIGLPKAYARTAIVRANTSLSRRRWFGEKPLERLPDAGVLDQDSAESDQLWQQLDALSHRQRCVLVLRYRYGYSDPDIAEMLGCRPASVRSLAARALAELRSRADTGTTYYRTGEETL